MDTVWSFEWARLDQSLSPLHREMESWDQPWRKESLIHYSSLGWSFVAINNDEIVGYLLGQPILFLNNWTQTLWVEHLTFDEAKVGEQLLDTTIRWARTKHLQKVLMNGKSSKAGFAKEAFSGFNEANYFHLSTTKLQE